MNFSFVSPNKKKKIFFLKSSDLISVGKRAGTDPQVWLESLSLSIFLYFYYILPHLHFIIGVKTVICSNMSFCKCFTIGKWEGHFYN